MKCQKCGYQNSQGAVFCSGCGTSLTATEQKKNNKPIIAAVIILIGVLALVGFFALRSQPKGLGAQASVVCTHNWSAATCTMPKTCTMCGVTEGSTAAHIWMDATCTHPKVCTVCFQEVGQTAGHQWPSNDHSQRMYCTVCGTSNGVEEKASQLTGKPSVEDVKPFGDVITYPKSSAYLDAYEIKYVKAPKGNSIYVFWNHDGGVSDSKRRFVLYEGDEVIVLARQGTRSCVIFTDRNGQKQIGWVNSDYLVEAP